MMHASLVIEADELTRRFGDFTAVDGISFSVRKGEIFGFLGPNGSGKTTTIRMVLGLLRPTSGRVMVLGQDAARDAVALRRRLGYMSQRFSLYPELTVSENLRFFARAYGVTGQRFKARQEAVLRMTELIGHEAQLTATLSGGWKQRLALAAALLHEPEILFLDEPTAGVDPVSRRAFWGLLYGLAASGTTIFVTTHYMDEAEHCHRLAFIYEGRITVQGAPAELRRHQLGAQVLEVDCLNPEQAVVVLRRAVAKGDLIVQEVNLHGSFVRLLVPEVAAAATSVERLLGASGIQVIRLEQVEASLEDVFVSLVRRQRER